MKKVLPLILIVALLASSVCCLAERDEPYVIEIMTSKANWELSTDNPVGRYIADKFGIVFKNVYYAGEIREKMSTNLAAGELGEIVYLQYNDMVSAYYNAGALVCLDDYLDNMPNFAERFAAQLDRWRQPTDGKLCKWESNTPNTSYESCEVLVRSDILELANWEMPTTASKLIALIEKASEAYPTTIDGMATVGMTVPFAEPWGLAGVAGAGYEKGSNYVVIGNAGVTFDYPNDRFVDYFLCPDVKESIKMFNTMYQKGILDAECFTDYCDQTSDKMATGQAMAVWYATWLGANVNNQLHSVGMDDYQYVSCFIQLDSQAEAGQARNFRIDTVRPFDSYAITTACRQPERVIELIEWACTDEAQVILQSGFEGETYTMENGKRMPTQLLLGMSADDRAAMGLGLFGFLPLDLSQNSLDGQFFNIVSEPVYQDLALTDRQREVIAKMGFDYSRQWGDEHGAFVDTGSAATITLDATGEAAKIQQQMVDCRVKYTAQLIMAESDEDFEAIWTNAMAEYDMLDHQSVVDEYNRLYAQTK